MISECTNEDCQIMMARYPDKFFDLAIVDPPYGIGKFWGTELDKDYFDAAEERFKKAIHEPLFQTQPEVNPQKLF